MNAWAWIIVVYWCLNMVAYVALIGKEWRFTVSAAVGALFQYPLLIWMLTRAVA